MINIPVYAVIMAGGKGERLWPLSTTTYPKQFLKVGTQSLLQNTVEMLLPLIPVERILVVTDLQHVPLVAEQLPMLPQDNIIGEPIGRGTAGCLSLAAFWIAGKEPDAVMISLPSDHVIKDIDQLHAVLDAGIHFAATAQQLVMLGVKPDCPATGFGYIRAGERIGTIDNHHVYAVERFTEKPDIETATLFLQDNHYYWNSGIFIWKITTFIEQLQRFLPDNFAAFRDIRDIHTTGELTARLPALYAQIASISVDKGILEHVADKCAVITHEFGWNDVGDWPSIASLFTQDNWHNAVRANDLSLDTEGSVIISSFPHKTIATLGIKDLVIVDTPDALLVMHKNRAQDVRALAAMYKTIIEAAEKGDG